MNTVPIREIAEGQAFLMPWREEGLNAGKLLRVGPGSVYVHAPKHEGDGWEKTHWSPGTEVIPCDLDLYHTQGFGEGGAGGRVMNRSAVEKPVDIVHRLCDDMEGATRDEIVKAAVDLGVNINTAKTQFYAWRKKNGPVRG